MKPQLDIYAVTPHFLDSVKYLFRNYGEVKLLPENTDGLSPDLVIFSGGSDINPKRYIRGYNKNTTGYDDKRDEIELSVIKKLLYGKFESKKVLGICRGLQILNVGFGGTLNSDILTIFGKGHELYHKIYHQMHNPLEFLTTVNSMHHQSINAVGRKLRPEILATHKDGNIEIIHWNNFALGVQFHPEFFPDTLEEKDKFVDTIVQWIGGKVNLTSRRSSSKKLSDLYTAYSDVGTVANSSAETLLHFIDETERS